MFYEEDIMVMEPDIDECQNPAVTGVIPNGYMTSKEFRRRATVKVNNFCKTYGIL